MEVSLFYNAPESTRSAPCSLPCYLNTHADTNTTERSATFGNHSHTNKALFGQDYWWTYIHRLAYTAVQHSQHLTMAVIGLSPIRGVVTNIEYSYRSTQRPRKLQLMQQ